MVPKVLIHIMLIIFQESERQAAIKRAAEKLAEELSGAVAPEEIDAIMKRNNEAIAQLEDRLLRNKERQQAELMRKLAEKRQKKTDALRWQHEQLVSSNCFVVCLL